MREAAMCSLQASRIWAASVISNSHLYIPVRRPARGCGLAASARLWSGGQRTAVVRLPAPGDISSLSSQVAVSGNPHLGSGVPAARARRHLLSVPLFQLYFARRLAIDASLWGDHVKIKSGLWLLPISWRLVAIGICKLL
jgi:hypothetical protein